MNVADFLALLVVCCRAKLVAKSAIVENVLSAQSRVVFLFFSRKIQHYFQETNSQHAKDILDNWDRNKYLFWQIIPKEMVNKFEEPVLVETTKTA